MQQYGWHHLFCLATHHQTCKYDSPNGCHLQALITFFHAMMGKHPTLNDVSISPAIWKHYKGPIGAVKTSSMKGGNTGSPDWVRVGFFSLKQKNVVLAIGIIFAVCPIQTGIGDFGWVWWCNKCLGWYVMSWQCTIIVQKYIKLVQNYSFVKTDAANKVAICMLPELFCRTVCNLFYLPAQCHDLLYTVMVLPHILFLCR